MTKPTITLVDLSRYFDMIRHDRMMAKVAKRVSDHEVLRLFKQIFARTGQRGIPQGSPLSPLLANLALHDLDHALCRGKAVLTYVRYLDDMVVLGPDSVKGRAWVDRALQRIQEEAALIGVSLNADKTRVLRITERDAVFAFLGFEFRWMRNPRTGRWYPLRIPRPKKVTQVLRTVHEVLASSRAMPVVDDGPIARDTRPKGEKQSGPARPYASTAPAPTRLRAP